MFVITHALVPVVTAQALALTLHAFGRRNPFRKRDYLALMVAGMMPDLLSPHLSLEDRWTSFSHTVFSLMICLPLALWSARRIAPEHPRIVAVLLYYAVFMHLLGDALSGGITWLYPWKTDIIGGRMISFNAWFAWDAWMVGVSTSLAAVRWWLDRRFLTGATENCASKRIAE